MSRPKSARTLAIIEAYKEGLPIKVIAAKHDCSIQFVSKSARRAGLGRHGYGGFFTDITTPRIEKRQADWLLKQSLTRGKPQAEIIRELINQAMEECDA